MNRRGRGVLMRSDPEVLIAGAGPTGLTLACGLLANGVAAGVVDKADGPAGTSRALGLQPRGIEVLERLGALHSLPERALQVERIVVHINGKHAASVGVGQRTALVTRPGLVISQAEVEAGLRQRVTELGGQIVWGREVAAAEQDSHGVSVRLADGGQRRVSWLVGATGPTAGCGSWLVSDSPASPWPSASCSSTSTPTSPWHGIRSMPGLMVTGCSAPFRFLDRTCGG
jgi:flavin-dependent dehydrogenase